MKTETLKLGNIDLSEYLIPLPEVDPTKSKIIDNLIEAIDRTDRTSKPEKKRIEKIVTELCEENVMDHKYVKINPSFLNMGNIIKIGEKEKFFGGKKDITIDVPKFSAYTIESEKSVSTFSALFEASFFYEGKIDVSFVLNGGMKFEVCGRQMMGAGRMPSPPTKDGYYPCSGGEMIWPSYSGHYLPGVLNRELFKVFKNTKIDYKKVYKKFFGKVKGGSKPFLAEIFVSGFEGIVPKKTKEKIQEAQKIFNNDDIEPNLVYFIKETKPNEWDRNSFHKVSSKKNSLLVVAVNKDNCYLVDKFDSISLEETVKGT